MRFGKMYYPRSVNSGRDGDGPECDVCVLWFVDDGEAGAGS